MDEQTQKRVVFGYSTGRCRPFKITGKDGTVSRGFMCSRGAPRKRCQVCKRGWSLAMCDHEIGGPCKKCKGTGQRSGGDCHACAATGKAMCSLLLCAECSSHREPETDYCPQHAPLNGFPAQAKPEPQIKPEQCAWGSAKDGLLIDRRCLHRGCPVHVEPLQHVLCFPLRRRAMCWSCGIAYERLFHVSLP